MGFALKKPEGTAGAAWPAICIGLFVAFGGVLFGYDTGTIGGILAMPYWISTFATEGRTEITPAEDSLIVSILSAGTFFGALLSAPCADILGRRWGIFASCAIVFNLGVILQTVSTSQPLFIAGRCIAGLGVGLISAMIPLYQSETSPKWIRGTVVGAYQLAITIGLLLAAIVNNATALRNDSGSYRIPIAVQFLWSLIICGGLLLLPETPRFLIKQDKHEQAAKALSVLRRLDVTHPALVEELSEIEANHRYEMSLEKASYLDCFRGNIGKRLLTGCLLQGLQQLTGVNFIFYYGTQYFQNAGFEDPFIISVITNCVNVFSTFPGLYLVEKLGRRNLLLLGASGMAVCQFIVAITGTVAGTTDRAAQQAAIAFVCIYIYFFASTWGPVAWVVTGEIFPLKVRAKCLSMTTATNWLLNFAIAYATPYMVRDGPGYANLQSKVFFIWGGCCFICIIFTWFLIYETKGLSLEQVDELYQTVNKAWQSKKFRPQISFHEVSDIKNDGRTMSLAEMGAEVQRKKSVGHEEKL
ncbi:hypothetical protein B0A48_10181 [Cryoendolithus antarcticus]|uniref:Major facilitator superfamily (MFS) profile domain-containing protein n=1 Tax=Cryoendolithus antarcticus TaxID=1507870 RepID=A0A1V8SWG0_9PEZI|nr:hypothetical protein B0A48_10181 [Cryoendolithus antarcticus]